jgi:hypothetical protein
VHRPRTFTVSSNNKICVELVPIFQAYAWFVQVVVRNSACDSNLNPQFQSALVESIVKMCAMNHIVWGLEILSKIWNKFGMPDNLAVVPSTK